MGLALLERGPGHLAARDDVADLVQDFLARYSSRTRQEYQLDLEDFARFMGSTSLSAAANHLLALAPGQANHLGLRYRTHLLERALSGATVNRRLAALRSLVKLASRLGLVTWALEVDSCKVESLRDTRGPGREAIGSMLRQLRGRGDAKGIRDITLRLMADLGLRVSEVVGLDVGHVDLARGVVLVLGKGKTQRQTLTLPPATREALAQWLEVRTDLEASPGPLFYSLSRNPGHNCHRLTARAVGYLLGRFGTRPHGLRHTAITVLLDKTNGNITTAQDFARHASPKTTIRYHDNLRDVAGEAAVLVSMEW